MLTLALVAAVAADPDPVARLGGDRLRHPARPVAVAYTPDGQYLVSAAADGVVRTWNPTTGGPLRQRAMGGRGVTDVRATPDGLVAVVGYDPGVRFLDPATLADRGTLPTAGVPVAFDVSATHVAAVEPQATVVYERATGLPMLELPDGRAVALGPDGKTVAVAAGEVVTVRRIVGGQPLHTITHGAAVVAVAFRPDGTGLLTAGPETDGRVKEWDFGKPDPTATFEGTGPLRFVTRDVVAVGREAGQGVGLYDLTAGRWTTRLRDAGGAFAVAPDGRTVVAAGTTGFRLRAWDIPSGEARFADDGPTGEPVLLHPADGRTLFLIAGNGAYRWPTDGPTATRVGTFREPVVSAAAGRGRLLTATASVVGVYDRFDPAGRLPDEPTRTVTVAGEVVMIAVSADGTRAAVGTRDRKVLPLDPATGAVGEPLPTDTLPLALAFTPDGGLVVVGRDGMVRRFDAGREAWKARIPRGLRGCAAVSADGTRVAVSSSGLLTVLAADTGDEVYAVTRAGDGLFHAAAFTPDGRFLLGGTDGPARDLEAWDTTTRTRAGRTATGVGGVVRVVALGDGRAAVAGADDTVTVWAVK